MQSRMRLTWLATSGKRKIRKWALEATRKTRKPTRLGPVKTRAAASTMKAIGRAG